MLLLFDFKCEDGHISEQLANRDTTELHCSQCPKLSKRIVSPVRVGLDPISGDFPGATAKWMKNRQQKIQQERKANS